MLSRILMKVLRGLGIAIFVMLICFYGYNEYSMRNPFEEVQWIEEFPGATERYVEYTPVLSNDKSKRIGPTTGADFAKLRFKDIDGDGIKEAIIETELLVDLGEFYSSERHVLKFQKNANGLPGFIYVEGPQLEYGTLSEVNCQNQDLQD